MARLPLPLIAMGMLCIAFAARAELVVDDAPVNQARELARAESAKSQDVPVIEAVFVGDNRVWVRGQAEPARVAPRDRVTLIGRGFGRGPDIDFSKVLVGVARALERDLRMYEGDVKLLKQEFFEKPKAFGHWPADILEWTDERIVFLVPRFAISGPIAVSVQKRTGALGSWLRPGGLFTVWDPLTERIEGAFPHAYDVVSTLSGARVSEGVPTEVTNPAFSELVRRGEAIYWAYDYNMGLVHHFRGLDWTAILQGKATDPTTGRAADPQKLFGAIPVVRGEVPEVALSRYRWNPYPAPMPVKPLLRKAASSGVTTPTGFAGYVYAESINPVTQTKSHWIGFNCASCHAQRVTYEEAPGRTVTRVFPGLPNNDWTMKWNALGRMKGVVGEEKGPDGRRELVDKTLLLFAIPPGTGEHSIVREAGDGSQYANDHLFSPIAIPIITRHTPIRRALSHTEMVAGFEGSYVHAEEPDGAIGALRPEALLQLTAYMATLDSNDRVLERVGLHRWLRRNGLLGDVDGAGEGEFVQRGKEAYPRLEARLARGKAVFEARCQSCHQPNFGTWTDENIYPFDQVGTYFSPTIFHRKNNGIRTAILRNLFWVEGRGLLHDGHVKSLEDLVHPERCREGSALYERYYTLHAGTFRVPKGDPAQERATRRHAYFTDAPWDSRNLYWDYQEMRRRFGPRELGSKASTGLPASPHPWCAGDAGEVSDLVAYLMTL